MPTDPTDPTDMVRRCTELNLTIACAESLTAGQLCARIADVPGASAVLRGGVVVYATELKHLLLGVDPALLAEQGPVHPEVARQMAEAVRRRFRADIGLATTGVAGPGPADGHPAGTVIVAAAVGSHTSWRELHLSGDRAQVRHDTVDAVLSLLEGQVALLEGTGNNPPGSGVCPPEATELADSGDESAS